MAWRRVPAEASKPFIFWKHWKECASYSRSSAATRTRPAELFADVGRALKPHAPFVVTFSNRMFPTKAVAIWRSLNDREHADLIGLYFRLAGRFEAAQAHDLSPAPGRSDPLYAVIAKAKTRTEAEV